MSTKYAVSVVVIVHQDEALLLAHPRAKHINTKYHKFEDLVSYSSHLLARRLDGVAGTAAAGSPSS